MQAMVNSDTFTIIVKSIETPRNRADVHIATVQYIKGAIHTL